MIYENTKEFAKHIEKGRPIIALDVGDAKIGVAVSDVEHIIASPREVYTRRNMSKDLGHISKLATDENACAFVVGFPLELSGMEGENCEKIRHFANKLQKKTNLPILLKDERFSTAAATRALSESGMTRKKRDSLDDMTAASIVLQGVLEEVESRV